MGRNLSSCRKNDSIMLYSTKNGPAEVYLAPKEFCGFIALVNGAEETSTNCKTIKTVVDGALRILLYTSKEIEPGQELFYNYGTQYKFHWKDSIS